MKVHDDVELANRNTHPLTQQQLSQWESDGYLLLRGSIPQANIDEMHSLLTRATDDMMFQLKAQRLTEEEKSVPLETRFFEATNWHANQFGRSWTRLIAQPAVFSLYHAEAIVDAVGQLTRTDVVGHPVFNSRPKLPNQELPVPWHQDSAYFGASTQDSLIITCWVPLIPVDASNGCMQIVRGSHRHGLFDHHREELAGRFPELSGGLTDNDHIVICPMEPGDVLLMNNLTLHRSLPNTSRTIRWSIDIRYLRDGDSPGVPAVYWGKPDQKWVIRSHTEPVTTVNEWLTMVEDLPW